MKKKYNLGNKIWEKNPTRRWGLSTVFSSNESAKKEELFVELNLTLWYVWLLQNLSSFIFLTKYHSQLLCFATEQDTMKKNGTPSPPSYSIFNITRYPSTGRVLTSSSLNCDKVLELLESCLMYTHGYP